MNLLHKQTCSKYTIEITHIWKVKIFQLYVGKQLQILCTKGMVGKINFGESTLWCKQKNYHSLTVFNTYGTLIYHGGYLEKKL
jgi:hypothetical protein